MDICSKIYTRRRHWIKTCLSSKGISPKCKVSYRGTNQDKWRLLEKQDILCHWAAYFIRISNCFVNCEISAQSSTTTSRGAAAPDWAREAAATTTTARGIAEATANKGICRSCIRLLYSLFFEVLPFWVLCFFFFLDKRRGRQQSFFTFSYSKHFHFRRPKNNNGSVSSWLRGRKNNRSCWNSRYIYAVMVHYLLFYLSQ